MRTTSWRLLMNGLGLFAGYLFLLLALVFGLDVVFRYILDSTASWIVDLEWYIGAVAICLALAPTLHRGKHVQVDILFARFKPGSQEGIIKAGHLLLAIPWVAFVIYASSRYAYNSWLIGEGSPDPGGLPFRWLIKCFIPAGFGLLLIELVYQLFTSSPYRQDDIS